MLRISLGDPSQSLWWSKNLLENFF